MKIKIFRWVAGIAGTYHAILAFIGTFANSDTLRSVVHYAYGVNLEITGQVFYLTKFVSAYMIAFAIAMFLLAWKPVQYRNLVWVAVGLYATRLLHRLLFFQAQREEFQFTLAQEAFTVIIISTIMVLLIALRPRSEHL